jgi:cell fate regulator YaaT (PSP1 superfamily)
VSTSAARYQDISPNPQKLAGQCGKLKCCMNFELDTYMDALSELPSKDIQLETADNTYYHFKTDVFKALISYSTSANFAANIVTISADRAKEIIDMNKRGEKPELLGEIIETLNNAIVNDYENVVGQDSLTRFDTKKKKNSGKTNNKKSNKTTNMNSANKPADTIRKPKLIKKKDQNKDEK